MWEVKFKNRSWIYPSSNLFLDFEYLSSRSCMFSFFNLEIRFNFFPFFISPSFLLCNFQKFHVFHHKLEIFDVHIHDIDANFRGYLTELVGLYGKFGVQGIRIYLPSYRHVWWCRSEFLPSPSLPRTSLALFVEKLHIHEVWNDDVEEKFALICEIIDDYPLHCDGCKVFRNRSSNPWGISKLATITITKWEVISWSFFCVWLAGWRCRWRWRCEGVAL